MPSPDYLEAGKFKLQRGAKSFADDDQEEGPETKKSYEEKYRQKL